MKPRFKGSPQQVRPEASPSYTETMSGAEAAEY